ncbi:hypothetical protein DL769_000067 [Monosporascus sp. CRB-8-3]|nr:hypothetical protein DL769_000067 [Monosporascus sp. CRB-8-3]
MAETSASEPATAERAQIRSIFGSGIENGDQVMRVEKPSGSPRKASIAVSGSTHDTTAQFDVACSAVSDLKIDGSPADPKLDEHEPEMVPTVFETFGKHQDLTLLVGTSPTAEFKVCSRTLARKVEFFDKMLYGPFAERQPASGAWVVRLPETDQASFKIFLALAHGDSSQVPYAPDPDCLYKLVIAIDYFNMYPLFKPWARGWSSSLERQLRSNVTSSAFHNHRLSLAWSFGMANTISSILVKVITEMAPDKDGQSRLKDGTAVKFDYELGRFDLENHIAQIRQYLITRISTIHSKAFGDIMDPNRRGHLCTSTEVPSEESREICDNALLGSLFKALGKHSISLCDIKPEALLELSLDDCSKKLQGIILKGVERYWRDHKDCNPTAKLQENIRMMRNSQKLHSPLTDEHLKYLKSQKTRWGF